MKKKILKTLLVVLLAVNMLTVPVSAANKSITSVAPCFNNIGASTLIIGFDENYVGYLNFSIAPYGHCTGFSGVMKLYDSTGNMLKSWAITDQEEPYGVEKTYQCQYGETYTLTFDGYAYGTNSMYDEIHMSVTDTCLGR